MERIKRSIVLMLALFVAGSMALFAQQVKKGDLPDTTAMKCMERGMHHGMKGFMPPMPDSTDMRSMGHPMQKPPFMGQRCCPCMMRGGMRPGMPMSGMQEGQGAPSFDGNRPYPGHRTGVMAIPDLTDKQKEAMAALMKDHREQAAKIWEESAKKVKDLREQQKEEMKKILTSEQLKWLEENTPDRGVAPAEK